MLKKFEIENLPFWFLPDPHFSTAAWWLKREAVLNKIMDKISEVNKFMLLDVGQLASELSAGDFCGEVLSNFNRIRKMVFEANEYIWAMAEQSETSHIQVTNEKVAKGLKLKFIMGKDLAKTINIAPDVEHLKERKYLERIPVTFLITERESAFNLRRLNGDMDYIGFFGTDEKFRKWTRDLFIYYWERAERWHPGIKIK